MSANSDDNCNGRRDRRYLIFVIKIRRSIFDDKDHDKRDDRVGDRDDDVLIVVDIPVSVVGLCRLPKCLAQERGFLC